MKRKVNLKLFTFLVLGCLGITSAGVAAFKIKKENPVDVRSEDVRFVEWKGKFAGGWNPNQDALKQDLVTHIIALNEAITKIDGSNLRDVIGSGDHVTINGVKLTELSNKHNVEFSHSQGNQYVLIRFRKDLVVAAPGKDYCEVHIDEGTLFDGIKLRELTYRINPTTFVAAIVPTNSIETNITGLKPDEYSGGWFRIDLENFPMTKKDSTLDVYVKTNFAEKIYYNGNPSNLLFTPGKESYSTTFNVGGNNGVSFNKNELTTNLENINSITFPAGTQFPYKSTENAPSVTSYCVTQKDQTFVRYGNSFFEEVPTNVTKYYPAVWGANQRAFVLDGFTDDTGSGSEKTDHPFNFNSNIYIDKDPSNSLFEKTNNVSAYFKMGHNNSFGVVKAKDFSAHQEQYVTIPAGTQFPDSKAWKGQVGGKVFVTQDEVTFGKQFKGPEGNSFLSGYNYKITTKVNETVNYGLTSFEGFTGSAEDYVSGGTAATNFPLNNHSPFGNYNVDFKFKVNNSFDNNFSGSFYISSTGACDSTKGGYEFKFAKTSIQLFYNGTQIGNTIYHTPDLPQFLDGEDIDIEICVIKTDATHVRLAFLMNDVALIDVVRDCSNDVLGNINSARMYTTTENPIVFKNVDVDEEALERFLTKALKMDDPSAGDSNFENAKDYFDNCLLDSQRQRFLTSPDYAEALARFEAWAVAHGEHIIDVPDFEDITTLAKAEVRVFDGEPRSLMFTTRFDASTFGDARANTLKFGTYMVVAESFRASSYATVGEYIEHTEKGSKTYADIPNTYMDFVNENTAKTDGFYEYRGTLANIKDGNITKEFIPVGYVKTNKIVHYGQNGGYATSLYAELLKVKDTLSGAQQILNKATKVLSLETNGTYEFNVVASSCDVALVPSSNGAYALTPSNDVNALFVDGKRYNVNIPANGTKYIVNDITGVKITDTPDQLKRGFAEPTHELWSEDTNQASYNTSNNNALVCQTIGAKSIRIWLSISNLVSVKDNWPAIGLVTTNRQAGWDFDENLVNQVKTVINKYKAAGVEEITLLVNSFARDEKSKIFTYDDGSGAVRRTINEGGSNREDWQFLNAFPDKYVANSSNLTDEYVDFISLNTDFYEKIGDAFDGLVTSVESMNEINLRSLDYDYRYCDDNYVQTIKNDNYVLDDQDFLAEMSMDYCKAMTDGIKASGADIRVLSPAISPVGDMVGSIKRGANSVMTYEEVVNVTHNKNGLRYLEECLEYIEAKGGRFNDYFQGLNIHPYLFDRRVNSGTINGQPNEAYLYINAPKGKVGFENQTADVDYNSNYAEDWGMELDKYHTMLEKYGDHNVPFYLTEIGVADKTNYDSKNWGTWNSTGFIRQVIRNLDAEICKRSWIKAYYWYRMYDFQKDGKEGEAGYGIIDYDGNLKYSGLELYYLINGEEYDGSGPIVDVGGGN